MWREGGEALTSRRHPLVPFLLSYAGGLSQQCPVSAERGSFWEAVSNLLLLPSTALIRPHFLCVCVWLSCGCECLVLGLHTSTFMCVGVSTSCCLCVPMRVALPVAVRVPGLYLPTVEQHSLSPPHSRLGPQVSESLCMPGPKAAPVSELLVPRKQVAQYLVWRMCRLGDGLRCSSHWPN